MGVSKLYSCDRCFNAHTEAFTRVSGPYASTPEGWRWFWGEEDFLLCPKCKKLLGSFLLPENRKKGGRKHETETTTT